MRLGGTANGRPPHPLAKERKNQGLTVRALAERVQMSVAGISHIETGRAIPRRSTKKLIADDLGVPQSKLWPEDRR